MHPNDGRVVSNFIVQALRGAPITVYGKGLQTRAFCYVDDLIEGMMRFMDTPGRLTNSKSEIVFAPLPADDPTQRCPDITLAKDKLGWEPVVTLEQGLAKTIAYFDTLLTAESA
jgi:UDP-glucuronate decarboxylase